MHTRREAAIGAHEAAIRAWSSKDTSEARMASSIAMHLGFHLPTRDPNCAKWARDLETAHAMGDSWDVVAMAIRAHQAAIEDIRA